MESILEQQRRLHEEREQIIKLMINEYTRKKTMDRDQILSDHRLKTLLELYTTSTTSLKELYEDKDGERKSEVQTISGPNEYSEFYLRLKQIKDFYKVHRNEISVPMSVELAEEYSKVDPTDELLSLVEFTDEEGFGKYLDLHECYEKYLNIRGIEKVDYITYIMTFDQFFDIPKERKTMDYKNYLNCLVEYLHGYLQRIKPLFDLNDEINLVYKNFEQQWNAGTFPGWPKQHESAMANDGAHLDLSAFSAWEELASLGLDRLKSALIALGIKCGGTLEERAQRLFSTKGQINIDPSLKKRNSGDSSQKKERQGVRNREIALLEAQLYRYAELVSDRRDATKENVQRKQARTQRELDEENDSEDSASDNDDNADDDVPYNPKNLPMGWDGKPIPYWLYKLHGLNISFSCEICGNYTYKGPKMFQRHFAEWRHAHGMRCLGIPNTAHFANVTQIEDAITLWEKLKVQKHNERWIPDDEEEYEDSMGNVVNRKTFADLKRQGLL